MAETDKSVLQSVRYRAYAYVWLALLALTATTVSVAKLHLTSYAIIVAILIATSKAALVIAYFMHLKYEPVILKVMLFVALLAFTFIILLTFSDIWYRVG